MLDRQSGLSGDISWAGIICELIRRRAVPVPSLQSVSILCWKHIGVIGGILSRGDGRLFVRLEAVATPRLLHRLPVGGLRLHRLATTPPDRVEPRHHHPPRSASPPHPPSPAGGRPPSSSDSEDSISLLFGQSGSDIDLSDGQLIDEVLEEHERSGWRLSPVSPAATPPPPNIFHFDAIEPEVEQDPLTPLEVVSLVQRAPALSDTVLFEKFPVGLF